MANKKISVFSSNLDKIKEKYMDYEYDYNLKKEDINWLIEQVERVHELEKTVEDYKTVNKELHQRGRKVRKQNQRYREALETIEMVTEFKSEANEIANKALEGTPRNE